ncbi:hypothetical protein BT69DRAFT_501505 [Atractiella rhizophila]|nr:hypothetical protein BT69DRAFT_501505 [Atractiella rhizophila]
MLLEGAAVVRNVQSSINKGNDSPWPFVMICCYVDHDMQVTRYLMCSENVKKPSGGVVYLREDFSLTEKKEAFMFLLGLYNSTSVIDWERTIDRNEIDNDLKESVKGFEAFWSEGSKRRRDADEKETQTDDEVSCSSDASF